MNEDLINRITYHLSSGGLFNPELADHLAVRNLLMECRDALAQRTWVGLDHQDKKKFSSWLDHKTDDEVFTAIDDLLREMNT